VVAVGEIGLDYHYLRSPREDQLRALDWQLELALGAGLPVVLHNRESWADLESRLVRHTGALRGVCHSFTEGPREAARVVELGLVVGENVTFRFFASSSRGDDAAGALVDPEGELVELEPVEKEIPAAEGRRAGEVVPVTLESHVTEVGTLELWCRARDGEGAWKLEYSVRGDQ